MKDAKALFLSLTLFALPALGQDESVTFLYPRSADHELIVATRIIEPDGCRKTVEGTKTYRVFGDGRLEIDPEPPWMAEENVVLEPKFVDDLLHSVDAVFDLGAHHQERPATENPDADAFIAVRLDRYTSPDHAIYLLDARMTEGLEPVFDDLRILETWVALAPGRAMWRSGPSWPLSCREHHRQEIGHRVLTPAWCGPPAFHKPESGVEDSPFAETDEDRERVQERLRERLRALPRGLQAGAEAAEVEKPSPCSGAGHGDGVELAPVETDSGT